MAGSIKLFRSKPSDWTCGSCGKRLTKWDERCCKALRSPMTCENCLAAKFNKSVDEFNEYLTDFYDMFECGGCVKPKRKGE